MTVYTVWQRGFVCVFLVRHSHTRTTPLSNHLRKTKQKTISSCSQLPQLSIQQLKRLE
jgi:hypothetical protein